MTHRDAAYKTAAAGRRSGGNRYSQNFARLLGTALLVLGLMFAHHASAQQSTGEVLGTVTDPSGATVPNATVTLTNTDTNDARTVNTTGSGSFSFTNLNPGPYKLVIQGTGFATSTSNGLAVYAGDRRRVDTSLKLGGSTENIIVTTASQNLQTDSSTLQNTITTATVANLPLNGRNYVQLVQITPGASEGNPTALSSGQAPDDRRQSSNVSINSQADVLNNNMIDGLDNNERIIGSIGVRPTIESIQEVKILTNTFTADSGRAAGAVVNIITKSGTNSFHGSLYEYFRNDKLNAFAYQFGVKNPKPALHQNQFGGSLGGPIFKDRTFFFGDADFLRVAQDRTPPGTASVPTTFEQNNPGNFSDIATTQVSPSNSFVTTGGGAGVATEFCNPGGTAITEPSGYKSGCAYNPATGYQYAGNVIPTAAIDPVGLNYFKLFSLPNASLTSTTGLAQYVGSNKRYQFSTNYDVRVDHKITNSNAIFARYSVNDVYTVTPSPALPPKMVAGLLIDGQNDVDGVSPQLARNAQINYSHTFTPNLLLLLGTGWTFIQNYSYPPNFGLNPNTAFGEPGINYNSLTSALGGVTFGNGLTGFGAGRPGFVPLLTKDNTYQINGAVFYTRGKQSFKAGAALIRRQASNLQEQSGLGNIGFVNGAPGLLTGTFSSAVRINNPFGPSLYRVWEPSGFLQDDWRATQKLTLNIGLRYDIFTPFVEKNNHIGNFLADRGLVTAGVNGVNRSAGVQITKTNVFPRIGFAYSPTAKTVLRGGFGMAAFVGTQGASSSLKDQPFATTFGTCSAATCPGGYNALRKGLPVPGTVPAASLDLDCGFSVAPAPGFPCIPQTVPSTLQNGFRDAYLEQFNLTVQQELPFHNTLTASYVGVLGRHLADGFANINLIPVGFYPVRTPTLSAGAVAGRRFYQAAPFARNTTQIQGVYSIGSESYNGLQATLARSFRNGFGYTATTTWSHVLDNITGSGVAGSLAIVSLDPNSPYFTTRYDYGDGDLDQRNRAVFQGNYSPEFTHRYTGIKRQLLDAWQGNVIAVYTTGLPFSVTNGSNVSLTSPGQNDRPNRSGDAFLNVGNSPVSGQIQYFNPLVFSNVASATNNSNSTGTPQAITAPAQLTGTVGNSRRNSLHGPAAQHVDIGLGKAFPIREGMRINFKAEGFNMLNSVIFANPNAGVTGGTFGRITATRADYSPRAFQFALRFEF